LITQSKSKQKPTKQKSSQVAVFNRSLENPKTPQPPQNPKKGGDFPKLKINKNKIRMEMKKIK
jgi:hypothetical protein